MPEGRRATNEASQLREPRLQVVEQRAQRAKVEDRQAAPILIEHPRQHREESGLGLAARSRGEEKYVFAIKDRPDRLLLELPQRRPTQGIDDVMLERRMKSIRGDRHR